MAGFQAIAPYLTNPIVLSGFGLLLFFGVHRVLIKAGIIPSLASNAGSKVVQNLLRYGFVVALVAIVLGFALAFYQARWQHDSMYQKGEIEKKSLDAQIEAAKAAYCQNPEKFKLDEATRSDADRACAQAVIALANTGQAPAAQKEDALVRLGKGDAQGAKAIFQEILDRKAAEGAAANSEAAEAARHLGALDFFDNTHEALAAYRRSVELDPNNTDGWNRLGILFLRVGQLSDAEAAFLKVKSLSESQGDKLWLATAYGNLGSVYQTRGDLSRAVAMYMKALELNEALGRKTGMATEYGNLGAIYQTHGDLVQAETMYTKALEINEAIGDKQSMAAGYGNLAVVYESRGDLAQAEAMSKKALEINLAIGRREGVARNYTNLGNVYEDRNDLAEAESLQKKALELNQAIGRKEGMADNYGNLGNVYGTRGDLAQAEEMYKKALEIDTEIGRKEGMAINYGNIGTVYRVRGDLPQAEATYKKALELARAIGSKNGMAADYTNLGILYGARGDFAQAEEMYEKAVALYTETGATELVRQVEQLLGQLSGSGSLAAERGQ